MNRLAKKTLMYQMIAVACLIGLLTGCATTASQTTRWTARQQLGANLTTWQAKGVISAKNNQGSQTAYVTWQQQPTGFTIDFSGPLGGSARLRGQAGHVTLMAPDGKIYEAQTPDALASRLFGWPLPIDGLQYWVRGLPAPTPTSYQYTLSQQHTLSELKQQGWRIEYLRYQQVAPYDLPYEIKLTRPGLQLHLIVKQWRLQAD